MSSKPGPFRVLDEIGDAELESAKHEGTPLESGEFESNGAEPPLRKYDCQHYETCLDLAAALDWSSFTCRNCVGSVDQTLYWRARQAQKRDRVASRLCSIPEIELHVHDEEPATPKLASGMTKR